MKKSDKLQMDKNYRRIRPKIEDLLGNASVKQALSQQIGFNRSVKFYEGTSRIIQLERKGELEVSIESLVNSFIHMSLNRLFPASQRLHELTVYYYLFKHYSSIIARQGYTSP